MLSAEVFGNFTKYPNGESLRRLYVCLTRAVTSLVVATGGDAEALARLRPSASLALGPLDVAAVRQIALLHAPAGAAAAVPV